MTDIITVVGNVAADPNQTLTNAGVALTSFRIASEQRHFDRASGTWVDDEPSWFRITAFRALAVNVTASIHKGDRVIVRGRLRVRKWADGDKQGITVEIEADAVGPDLRWGSTTFSRTVEQAPASAEVTDWAASVEDAAGSEEPSAAESEPQLQTADLPF